MSDYIKREDAIKKLKQLFNRMPLCEYMLDEIPSADVAEVIHGHWEEDDEFVCSVCGYEMVVGGGAYNYCPNCGARMDEKEQEHE